MTPKRILVIEDDPDIAALLKHDLGDDGYTAEVATSVMQGLIQAREWAPDLVLLDLGLPDGDGRDVLVRLRRSSEVAVIVLTARDDVEEKVELLSLGADDYVVKPFHQGELLARIAVQLRQHAHRSLTLGELEVFPDRRLVLHKGQELRLSPKEFEVLALLISQPGRVFSRQELVKAIWNGNLPDTSNVVDVHLANLRGKLRDIELYGLLRTVRGVGYALRG